MKVNPTGLERFLRKPDPAVRLVLVHGDDAGLVRELADRVALAVVPDSTDPFLVADLTAKQIDDETARPLLTLLNPDEQITELAVDDAGDVIYFITDNGVQFRVHQLSLALLTTGELDVEQAPIAQLVVGPAWRTVAWRVGLCNDVTQTVVRDDRSGTALTVGIDTPLEGLSLSPIGWLDGARLVVASRHRGSARARDRGRVACGRRRVGPVL